RWPIAAVWRGSRMSAHGEIETFDIWNILGKVILGYTDTMATKSKRLTLLSDAEQFALYGLPDFDDGQQSEYLSLSEVELALACTGPGLHAQVYGVLQIGYFKAKHVFFHFAWSDVEDDCAFVLTRYFIGQAFEPHPITKHERFAQRVLIAERFGYRLWSADF